MMLRRRASINGGVLGAELVRRTLLYVRRTLLYWWPDDRWLRGAVARLCPRGAFT